jgi:hypothetical protein
MNKVDLFVIAAPNFDSPIIRDFIHKYHNRFNKVFYIFSYSQVFNEKWRPYTTFVENDLKDKCEVIYCRMSGALDTDWRDECVQEVLKRSTGDYIFSMEPDFIGDWDKIVDLILNKNYSLFSMLDSNLSGLRLWPCFWGCKKSLLSQIKYPKFGAPVDARVKQLFGVDYNKKLRFNKDGLQHVDSKDRVKFYKENKIITEEVPFPHFYDHFDLVSAQLMDIIQDDGEQLLLLNRMDDVWYYHIAGITHDFHTMYEHNRIARDTMAYRMFYDYCMKTNVNMFPDWLEVSSRIINS